MSEQLSEWICVKCVKCGRLIEKATDLSTSLCNNCNQEHKKQRHKQTQKRYREKKRSQIDDIEIPQLGPEWYLKRQPKGRKSPFNHHHYK